MLAISRGSKGEAVRTLQERLSLAVDGVFGAKTEAAVKAFQSAHGLTPDGIVGPKTWAAIGVTNSKCVDPSVIYAPLTCCITKSPNRTIKYLAIHYTAGSSSSAGRAIGMKSSWEKKRRASADFGVDDATMVQFNPDPTNYFCWAVGDKKAAGAMADVINRNTISIEICSNLTRGTNATVPNHSGWYFTEAAIENALKLTRILMKRYNIPRERVIRHYDASGKLCPGLVGWNDGALYTTEGKSAGKRNTSEKWEEFKKRLP